MGGRLFVWLTDFSPFSQLGMLGDELPFVGHAGTGFLGGIELAIFFLLVAFAGIVFFDALAELSVVLVETALNTRGLLTTSARTMEVSVPALPAAPAPVPPLPPIRVEEPPVLTQRKCAKCGQLLDAGNTFCDECGNPVG